MGRPDAHVSFGNQPDAVIHAGGVEPPVNSVNPPINAVEPFADAGESSRHLAAQLREHALEPIELVVHASLS